MSKKTNSKSKTKSKKATKKSIGIYSIISVLLAVLSVSMIFANVSGVAKGDNVEYVITGLQATFGYSEETRLLGTLINTQFSIFNLLIYVFLIAGIVLLVLKTFKILKSNVIDWVVVGLFLVSGILYFVMPQLVVYGKAWDGAVKLLLEANYVKTVLIGGIIGGITSILAGLSIVTSRLTAKNK